MLTLLFWPLWILLVAVPLLLLLLHLLGPLLVRAQQRPAVQPRFEALDPEQGQVPADIWPFFTATQRALHGEGFREAGHFVQRDFAPNVETWVLALEHRERQEAAIAVGAVSTAAAAPGLKSRYVEFSASWEDDSSVSAGNMAVLPAFPPVPAVLSVALPELSDPVRLLAVHRALVARHGTGARRRYPPEGGFQGFLEDGMARELARQLPTGYLELAPGATRYRLTWKGACLATWSLLFPWTLVRRWRRRRKNARLLAELGV